MKYDDASWHYEGDFPEELPWEAGGTHIGMFLAWAFLNGLAGEIHQEESADELRRLMAREITGREFLFACCDGKLVDEDLAAEGNEFALHYYKDSYFDDVVEFLGVGHESVYHAENTWEEFDRLRERLDERFSAWRRSRSR